MTTAQTTCTVYFDGSCPLCTLEISYYQAQEGAQAIRFVDVSAAEADLGPGLQRTQSLARFHVRDVDGRLMSGAAAFATLWRSLPRFAWLGRIASSPGVLQLFEGAYRAFLIFRPLMQRIAGAPRKSAASQAALGPAARDAEREG